MRSALILSLLLLWNCGLAAQDTTTTQVTVPDNSTSAPVFLTTSELLSSGTLDDIVASYTLKARRLRARDEQTSRIVTAFTSPLTTETEKLYADALSSVKFSRRADDLVASGIRQVLTAPPEIADDDLLRSGLEATYELFPHEMAREVRAIAESTTHPKLFAMACNYLLRHEGRTTASAELSKLLHDHFPEATTHPILMMLDRTLQHDKADLVKSIPDLADLLSRRFAPAYAVVYSLQRVDRRYPGLAIIRRPDSSFVRKPDGQLFAIPHLALSNSDLPGYITNGNTPEGIFSIIAITRSRNRAIGPTPLLETVLPFEATPEQYFHRPSETSWTLDLYKFQFPPSWRNYLPMEEGFYAGAAGRTEMIVHGTALDPEVHKGQPYYPITPTIGCMCAAEIWSDETGHPVMSNQFDLVKTYADAVGTTEGLGFLAIVNIDAKQQPVTLDDISPIVGRAEAK